MKETKEIAYGILSQGYQVVMKFQTAENKNTSKSKSIKVRFEFEDSDFSCFAL